MVFRRRPENQVDKKMDNEMKTGLTKIVFLGIAYRGPK